VSAPDKFTPAVVTAAACEGALVLCGIWLAWRCALSPAARQSRPRLAPWAIPPVDFVCFLCFAFVGATSLSAAAGYFLRHARLDSDHYMVAGGAVMHAGILLGVLGFFRVYGFRSDPPPGGTSFGRDVRSGLVTFLIGMPVVSLASVAWQYLLDALGLPDDKQDMVAILQNSHDAPLILLLVSVATLLVPVTEELVFRAGLFRYFRTRMPRWVAIVGTSALFGALHMSLASFMPLTVLAIVFCLAYERTGSVRTTMVAHALFNLNTFVIVVAGIGT
jgi:membrane protease YdiL (CAAX protease family)